jgi:signal transduction histidine kinase
MKKRNQLLSPIIDRRRWLVWVWLIFTVALAAWQFVFVVRLISEPQLLITDPDLASRFLRMVHYENYTLIASLIGGGIALFLLLRKEQQKAAAQQEFFATFTHEIKTAIAGIKLRAERIQSGSSKDLSPSFREDMVKDLNRLDLSLENSLFLAREKEDGLFTERISLSKSRATYAAVFFRRLFEKIYEFNNLRVSKSRNS